MSYRCATDFFFFKKQFLSDSYHQDFRAVTHKMLRTTTLWTSLVVPRLRLRVPNAQVRSLVRELDPT